MEDETLNAGWSLLCRSGRGGKKKQEIFGKGKDLGDCNHAPSLEKRRDTRQRIPNTGGSPRGERLFKLQHTGKTASIVTEGEIKAPQSKEKWGGGGEVDRLKKRIGRRRIRKRHKGHELNRYSGRTE